MSGGVMEWRDEWRDELEKETEIMSAGERDNEKSIIGEDESWRKEVMEWTNKGDGN